MTDTTDKTQRGWLRPSEVARVLGVSRTVVGRWCSTGRMRSVVMSDRGDRLIPASELERIAALADSGGSIDA
jgi:excisionase family DNA binding protein